MNAEEYVAAVGRRLRGMDARVRRDILSELRSHLRDAGSESGNPAAVASALEAPEVVARRYRELYGYGLPFRLLFVLVAGLLSVATVPALFVLGEEATVPTTLAVVALVGLVVYLLVIALAAGRSVGLAAGATACGVRLVILAAVVGMGVQITGDATEVATYVAVSAALVAVGALPGRRREAWDERASP